jgi:serine/threonine protein kinase
VNYVGTVIDSRYKVESLIGEGGMGVVYQCVHTIIGKKVALKILRPDFAQDSELTERFLNEAKAASTIRNPHIVDVSDFGQLPDGSVYFVMELLVGTSLRSELDQGQQLPASKLIRIARQLAEGLSAAHAAAIVHRDLKPDNVFLVRHGGERDFVKILDFGIAKIGRGERLTRAGAVFGTPHYMSPEQAAGLPVDHRGDIYSLGVIMYEMASGRVPFDADNFMGILTMHLYKAPVPLRALVPPPPREVTPGIEAILLKCLSKRPDHRYESMDEVISELDLVNDGRVPEAVHDLLKRSGGFHVPADYLDSPAKKRTIVSHNDRSARELSVAARSTSDPDERSLEGVGLAGFKAQLPLEMQGHADALFGFLDGVFAQITFSKRGVATLGGARIPNAQECEYVAIFMGQADQAKGVLGAATFLSNVQPLEEYLEALGEERRKIVIAVSYARELGPGVPTRILDYLRRYRARVIPMHVREIVNAHQQRSGSRLFRERLLEFEIPNLFLAAGSSSPTSLVGIREAATRFVMDLQQPRTIPLVLGLPGSGKTALFRLAEFGLPDTRLVVIPCNMIVERTVDGFIAELERTFLPEGAAPMPDTNDALARAFDRLGQSSGKARPILVLDDADWLIDLLDASENDVRLRTRSLWTKLLRQLDRHDVRMVITSVRGSLLANRNIGGWDNPVAPRIKKWHVTLDAAAVARIVDGLAAQMDVTFDGDAIESVARRSGGHIGIAMQLAGRVVADLRESSSHPMARLSVSRKSVDAAADRLAGASTTFRDGIFAWFNELERRSLQVIATKRIRSLNGVRNALPDTDPKEVEAAFAKLQDVGAIDYQRGAYRIKIPLFETWIARHVDRDPDEPGRLRAARFALVAVGALLTFVPAGFYSYYTTAESASSSFARNGCTFDMNYPKTIAVKEVFKVQVVRRECASGARIPKDIEVRGEGDTLLSQVGSAVTRGGTNALYSQTDLGVLVERGPLRSFSVVLAADQAEVGRVSLRRNPFAELGVVVRSIVQLLMGLPLLLGVIAAFNRRTIRALQAVRKATSGRS